MTDLTIIYYTDNSLPNRFAAAIRDILIASAREAGGIPVISVSQKPLDFGQNICVGPIGRSYQSILRQIEIGSLLAETKYVALCEHDVLYTPDHFFLRPIAAPVIFDQNRHRALIDQGLFAADVGGRSMQLVIAEREAIIDDFRAKVRRASRDSDFHQSFEPGKGKRLGVRALDYEMFPVSGIGILDICNHGGNYGVAKRGAGGGRLIERLEPWGGIDDLCARFHINRSRTTINHKSERAA